MFNNIIDGFIELITPEIDKHIVEIRSKYLDVRQKVLDYCKKHSLIISDPRSLIEKPDPKNIDIHIYCDNAEMHAKNIANDMQYIWVKMQIKVPREEFVIYYDTMPLVFVYAIQKHKNISLSNIIMPVEKDVNYMSPELELISLYQDLYSPFKDRWHIELEAPLINMVKDRVAKKILIGGKKKCDDCSDNRKNSVDNVKLLVLKEFATTPEFIVVGQWARTLLEGSSNSSEKLQLITTLDIEVAIKNIMLFLERYTKSSITFSDQNLHIPKDTRTRRYTLYMSYASFNRDKPLRKPFLDIFNSGTFELIPIEKHNYYIGNPFVLLRFYMIDLWIVRLVHKLELISKDVLTKKINNLMDNINFVRSGDWMDRVFLTDYVGQIIDINVANRMASLDRKMLFPYYPYKK